MNRSKRLSPYGTSDDGNEPNDSSVDSDVGNPCSMLELLLARTIAKVRIKRRIATRERNPVVFGR